MSNQMTKAPDSRFNFAEHLIHINRNRPTKAAYIDNQGVLSYGELSDAIRRFASALQGAEIRREERVLILMHDSRDWPIAFLGCLYAGVVPVAVNTLLTADDYRFILNDCRARMAVVSAPLMPVLDSALDQGPNNVHHLVVSDNSESIADNATLFHEFVTDATPLSELAATHADEPGFWLYSSGSTGRPKGTVHTHGNLYWTAELYGKGILGISENDICFSAAKLFFAYGLGNALSFPLSVGASVLLMAERPTPNAVFTRWVEHQPTIFFGAPTGYAGMLASPALPAREQVALRLASSAGEALPLEIGQRFTNHFGVEVIDGIGSTEMLHIYLSNNPGDVQYGTTGRPVPGYDIQLRDDEGGLTPDGEIGELYVRGPSAALMYWNNRDKSRLTFQGEWTKSGDKYVRNTDGVYVYSGRTDDMLKVSGIYVSPFEVESALMQHESVLEVAVVGHEDENGLTKPKAFVVLKDGCSAVDSELKNFVKDRIAPFKYPRFIEFIEALPKTATGKIQRFRLRERDKQNSA